MRTPRRIGEHRDPSRRRGGLELLQGIDLTLQLGIDVGPLRLGFGESLLDQLSDELGSLHDGDGQRVAQPIDRELQRGLHRFEARDFL